MHFSEPGRPAEISRRLALAQLMEAGYSKVRTQRTGDALGRLYCDEIVTGTWKFEWLIALMYGCGSEQESSEVALDGLVDEFLSDDFIERDAAVQVRRGCSLASLIDCLLFEVTEPLRGTSCATARSLDYRGMPDSYGCCAIVYSRCSWAARVRRR